MLTPHEECVLVFAELQYHCNDCNDSARDDGASPDKHTGMA